MAERDPEAVRRFVERFASDMVEAGMQRMPSRVFGALIGSDTGRLTAAELAETLQASPAAISGAVRYLAQVHMVRREREPGSRRDLYVVDSDIWYETLLDRDRVIARWRKSLEEGIEALGADTPAGERLAITLAFFDFVGEEMEGFRARWQVRKAELLAARRS
ncbi:MarR family transcriptional regulator [Actinoallomurus vinaceus]|uniref:MarR family transcriptional regulator n=1 Tax=Actinoallomurus vinaceus TaxID=1080074 RepID=A0ABP8UJ15_9ACTN